MESLKKKDIINDIDNYTDELNRDDEEERLANPALKHNAMRIAAKFASCFFSAGRSTKRFRIYDSVIF